MGATTVVVSVILATLRLDAADADQPLPRNVPPTEPRATDPFKYPEPEPNQGRRGLQVRLRRPSARRTYLDSIDRNMR